MTRVSSADFNSFVQANVEGTRQAVLETLDSVEARILGCLVEKEATTPDQYPLTANAIVLACNQKNNREPVLELEAGAVGHALRQMAERGLVRVVDGARALRYDHRFAQHWSLTTRQAALLAVLILRGPQTLAELHARSERLAPPAEMEQSRLALERLFQRSPALVINLGHGAGQREDRYMHLLCGPVAAADFVKSAPAPSARGGLDARVEALEAEVAALRDALQALCEGR